ncbi:MAG: CRISPR-associated endonuclease Cas1 [Candidatus Andersenbacteria bacterium]|nr:CRISPR-associated endonuclease Cas1 [Candidatus Andersenbacteria bacterium]
MARRASCPYNSLLRKCLAYQKRYESRRLILQQSIAVIRRAGTLLETADALERQAIFLHEARATAGYWRAVGACLRLQDPDWRRQYPHARDPVNMAFNIGYTRLAQIVRPNIEASGLLPHIGILHGTGDDSNDMPLLYDMMELFRQPVVDAVVIPFFTKHKQPLVKLSPRDIKRLVAAFERMLQRPVWFKGQCVPVRVIIERELVSLRQAIISGRVYVPYKHPWGHSWTCKI